jgi:hypothetical protein
MIAPFINRQDELSALSSERRLLFFHRSISGAAVAIAYLKFLPAVIAPHEPHPDLFQYEVTVQDDGRLHTVMVSEEATPENLRPLIRWLSEAARQGRKGAGNK